MSESDTQPSYRSRNVALAVIAGVIVAAAVLRMAMTAAPPAPAATAAQPTTAHPAPVTQPTMPIAAPQMPAATAGGTIDVTVSYRGATAGLPQTAKVYVFIRPVGQRMPLAVQTYSVADLPVTVEFSSPNASSASARVETVARLSLTGAVALQPGDSEVVADPVQFDATGHQLSLTLPGPPAE
jgi:hypothetical protein